MKILVSACLLGVACRYDGNAAPNEAVVRLMQDHALTPFCPEIYGGLPTPREPAEIRDGRAYTRSGADVTDAFQKGAREALRLAKLLGCDCAVLQDRSPSCGCGFIYDGRFTGALTEGDGVTAKLLKINGIRVVPASRASELSDCLCPKRCERHGDCAACRAYHGKRGKLPFCERNKRGPRSAGRR
jgi:uncharacterized protein YbbK (DUF523 family)